MAVHCIIQYSDEIHFIRLSLFSKTEYCLYWTRTLYAIKFCIITPNQKMHLQVADQKPTQSIQLPVSISVKGKGAWIAPCHKSIKRCSDLTLVLSDEDRCTEESSMANYVSIDPLYLSNGCGRCWMMIKLFVCCRAVKEIEERLDCQDRGDCRGPRD